MTEASVNLSIIPGYRLDGLIGASGAGAIYRGHHLPTG
jgi:hypothetical protein